MSDQQTGLAHLLAELPGQFRAAMQAQRNFLEWRGANHDAPFADFGRKYAEWCEAGEPYARSYREAASKFPQALPRIHDLLMPIQREYD